LLRHIFSSNFSGEPHKLVAVGRCRRASTEIKIGHYTRDLAEIQIHASHYTLAKAEITVGIQIYKFINTERQNLLAGHQ
jgi:hypothetical protein